MWPTFLNGGSIRRIVEMPREKESDNNINFTSILSSLSNAFHHAFITCGM